MLIKPKTRGFICTTAHPDGCAQNVRSQIAYAKQQKNGVRRFQNALIIGASTGYGLSSAIAAAYSCGANVLGVAFERNAHKGRTATAGFYNSAAFLHETAKDGLFARMLMGDAFADQTKQKALDILADQMGAVDLLIYSLAAPVRTLPETGARISSTLKPIGQDYVSKNVDIQSGQVSEVRLPPATQEEIDNTITVMGGDDWQRWVSALKERSLLADDATTIAYSYIGPSITHPIYKDGTIGRAKQHLKQTADSLHGKNGVSAYVSVNKAVVTQSSSAIPVVPLYISILFKVMQEKGCHEGCIQQICRLAQRLTQPSPTDSEGYIRMDDWEMRADIQDEVMRRWQLVNSDNIASLADLSAYNAEFLSLFGFGVEGIDESLETNEVADETNMILL
ncbi:MAG: enoyl-ACP reductase FabV [Christensenellales bacterium]|jgi:enoyl-[acyl-carrier protein] reductase/trans-2-enoyl-CoA reductase (NAD+)